MMFVNGWVISQVNQENRLFQPVFGFSLSVFVFYTAALILVWVWWKQASYQYFRAG